MRLSTEQVEIIKQTASEIFGDDTRVWLYGSRTNSNQRGGDIDLYIETAPTSREDLERKKTRFWIRLQRKMGEQRIDVIAHIRGEPMKKIEQEARSTGVLL